MSAGDAVRQLLEEISARAQRATEGPWEVYVGADLMVLHARASGGYDQIASTGSGADLLRDSDAAFIAQSRTDVPRLVAALTAVLDHIDTAKGTGRVPDIVLALEFEQVVAAALHEQP